MTDPIADMFTRIRNAQAVSKDTVEIPSSQIKLAIAKLLERSGFVRNVEVVKRRNFPVIKIKLKYKDGASVISLIRRVSKPGQRLYSSSQSISNVKGGYGITILSTSKGLMSGKEAKEQGIGGEIIGELW